MSDVSGSAIAALCCLFVVVAGSATVVAVVDDRTASAVQQTGSSDGVTTETRVGGDGTDRVRAVVRTGDGGYLLAGQTNSFGDDTDAWLVRLDADGTERWNRTYGGPGFETFRDVEATDDGGYVAVGSTRSTLDGSSDVYALKVDDDGDVTWGETYGGPRYDDARAVVTDGDGYTLAGATRSRGSGGLSGWVLHVDTDGTPAWNRTYGGVDDDAANDLIRVDDGYVVAGATASGTATAAGWVLHVGPDGGERWERSLTDGAPTAASAVVALNDAGGYVVVGERTPEGGGATDAWAARVGGDGTPAWNRTYGSGGSDTAVDAVVTDDGPVFAGSTTGSNGTREPWLVGLDRDGGQRSVTVAGTDGRERIGALDGTSGQFAVVGWTDETDADGVFVEVTADRDTPTPTDDESDGSDDSGDDDPNAGGSDDDSNAGGGGGDSTDGSNTGGTSSGGSPGGDDGGRVSTPTTTPTPTVTSTTTLTQSVAPTTTPTSTVTSTATPTSTVTSTATPTPTQTPTPTTATATSTPTTTVDDGETTVADGDGGGQAPTTTTETTSGTAPLFGLGVVLAIVVGLVLAGYRARD